MGFATGDVLPVIGALLGHADVKTTARYAHWDPILLRVAGNGSPKASENELRLKKSVDVVRRSLEHGTKRFFGFFARGTFLQPGQPPLIRFIILGRPRTGSNMLVYALKAHPEIYARGEIFQRIGCRDFRDVLQATAPRRRAVKAVGFKLMYNHPLDRDLPELWDHLRTDKSIQVIHLERRNFLETHLSSRIGG
jgi:hypothetical protein